MNNELTIQLRYCFNDENLHSMNAEVFNECEKQFIKAIKSTEKYMQDTLILNIKPREKGSLYDIFTATINNPAITATFLTLITIFATKFFDAKFSSAIPKTEETSKKLDNIQKIRDAIKNETLTETDFDYIASNDRDLRKHKSNFFKNAKKVPEITKVEAIQSVESLQPIIIVVNKDEFDNFIIPETTEKIEDTQQVKIYIVAPILVEGRPDSWKGILIEDLKETPIDFKITDKAFLAEVHNHLVKFSNGTFINCELKTTLTTNIETEETKISRRVINVINCGEDNGIVKNITHKRRISITPTIPLPSLFD